ncbi:MAG: tetratricopeptide repeat protein [Polyangiaceae bacterium]|nr:tetratricopeptide repeat protein [Polyangiaceae bacterium]
MVANDDPTLWATFTPLLVLAALLYTRSPGSNYIFDEQEALLANPYVNGKDLGWLDVIRRDFWGLPPDRSIGSYRPLPNLVWRALWQLNQSPWLPHWVNVVVHSVNAALVGSFAFAVTRRRDLGWLTAGLFLVSAVLTEAVSGVVGLADVLGGLGVLAALHALRLPLWSMPLGVAGGILLALFSKESGIVGVPLLAWAALVTAPRLHEQRPLRLARAALALAAATAGLVTYVELRRRFFPVELPEPLRAPLSSTEPLVKQAVHEFQRWFQQPRLPSDPVNNPLIQAPTFELRAAGALRVYARGLGQVLFPWTLSGDYSMPAEPVPDAVIFPESVIGALGLVVPPLVGLACFASALRAERRGDPAAAGLRALVALGLLWFPIAYFPHSNIPVLLPTVRAERFWYLPVVGTSTVLGVIGLRLLERGAARGTRWAALIVGAFLSFQAGRARAHAVAYTNDLMFWDAMRRSTPRSAKAHLNYSVMVGARGRLEERVVSGSRAVELAPTWPMAHVYLGDALCRLQRPLEAWPHMKRGFALGPNESNLLALALQCLWDIRVPTEDGGEVRAIEAVREELVELAAAHPGTWLAYLAIDTLDNGEQHGGVDRKYRPRGYDEGPKQ